MSSGGYSVIRPYRELANLSGKRDNLSPKLRGVTFGYMVILVTQTRRRSQKCFACSSVYC